MKSLRNTLLDVVDNRIGDSRSSSSTIRCIIYTGLMYDRETSAIIQCPGYLKEQAGVWVCPKTEWTQFSKGEWARDRIEDLIADVKAVVGVSDGDSVLDELRARNSPSVVHAIEDLRTSAPIDESDTELGVSKILKKDDQRQLLNPMWEQLAFYDERVVYVELKSGEENRIPGKDIRPGTCEVVVRINASGRIELTGAELMLQPALSRLALNACVKGGGYDPEDQGNVLVAKRTAGTSNKVKIQRSAQALDSMYASNKPATPFDIALDGDVWHEGVRSSIGHGLFEVWVDNANMGPMLKISRQAVQQAAARYTRNVSAGEMRYATERDHPASAHLASTAVTPVRVYIDDWFGDPNFYIGAINALMTIISGFDDEGSSSNHHEKYVDLGAFDYGRIYNTHEGVSI